ncbi:transglutaminase domain-containing protein [Candidatus Wolfebacteria bacterium]|nr:transglutaminase domain-containing protein [Candidatus Wolfebacteria bacterium]
MFKIKTILHRLKESLGLAFYLKPQLYSFSYSGRVENLSSENNEIIVIFPVAGETVSQKIKKGPVFSPAGHKEDNDIKFKNRYVWWRVVLSPKESVEFSETGEVEVFPNAFSFEKSDFRFDDYRDVKSVSEYQLYLFSDYYLNGRDEKIKALAEKAAGGEQQVIKTVLKLYEFARDYLTYGNPIKGLYSFKEAMLKREVDCGGFTSFFGSLCMAKGIPSRIVSGFWAAHRNHNGGQPPMHAWAEFMLPDGRWIPADPSVEHLLSRGRTDKSGRFGFVGSDRVIFSRGSDILLEIEGKKITADILQNPIVIAEKGDNSVKIEFVFSTQ